MQLGKNVATLRCVGAKAPDAVMLYFAYGSNLDQDQLTARCPTAELVGAAMLADHRLCFPRTSKNRQCGVASIEAAPGGEVWGAVYRLAIEDVMRLDGHEGYKADRPAEGNPYNRVALTVTLNGADAEVETYVATAQPTPLPPNQAYVAQILKGARHHGLPAGYIAALEAIRTA